MNTRSVTLALALVLASAVPAAAWWTASPPDPHPGNRTHYQNDPTQQVQDRLEDCWLFEVQTWQRALGHWTAAAAWECSSIATAHRRGIPLSAAQTAMETLLLAFEAEARAWSAKGIGQDHIERSYHPNDVLPDALALRSGWYAMETLQNTTADALGLREVLGAMH